MVGRWIAVAVMVVGLGVSAVPAAPRDLRIGVPVPLTGGLAEGGRDMVDGLTLYLEEHGKTLGGRPVTVVVEDTTGTPTVALTKARKLVERDRVEFLMGLYLASEGYALRDFVSDKKVLLVLPVVAADDLTQRRRSAYVVRLTATSSQVNHAFGEYAYRTLGYRRVAVLGQDYAFGWENAGGFQRTFEDAGGRVVQKLWAPLGTMDYAPYISRLRRDVDALYVILVGADIPRFFAQYKQFGVKVPVLGGIAVMDEDTLRHMGEEAVGVVSAHVYTPELKRTENERFVAAFQKRFGRVPSYFAEAMYTAALWIDQATRISGWPANAVVLPELLRRHAVQNAPRGPLSLDAYNNTVETVYVRRVVMGARRPQNEVIATIPRVSQFWKWEPREYLRRPPYTKDYPPCRFCER